VQKFGLLVIGASMLVGIDAHAEWTVKVEEPDVFGNRKVVAITAALRDGLIVQCDQTTLELGYLFKKKQSDDIEYTPAELLVQVDGGKVSHLSANLRPWNEDYGGVVASSRDTDTVAVLRLIGTGKRSINIGAVINDARMTASFDTIASTAAMDSIIKNCGLADLKPDKP